MLAEKDLAMIVWEMLKTMHVGVEHVKEAKLRTLKSEFEDIPMKDSESIEDFSMKLMTIVSDIHLLSEEVPSSCSPEIHANC